MSGCTEDTYDYKILSASKIDTITNQGGFFYQINPGNDLVFRYTHNGPDCINIADEEYSEILVFQVPSGLNSFVYMNDQLKSASCYFKRVCFCPPNTVSVSSGTIKGTRTSDTKWKIDIDIELPGNGGKIVLNKTFTVQ